MSRMSGVLFLFVVILGFVLFLYGSNYYNALVGWVGVYLFVGAILVWVLLYLYGRLKGK
jgi:hypothetical protein